MKALKKSPECANTRGLRVNQSVDNDCSKNLMIIQETITERTVVITRPACPSCGAALEYAPYRIGGREEYEWHWCCPNISCESHWPEGPPDDLKVIELPAAGGES